MKHFESLSALMFMLFIITSSSSGQISTASSKGSGTPLPGQIMVDPGNPAWFVYNRDSNGDSMLDPLYLCGPGDPEGFLYRGKRRPDGTRDGDQVQLIEKLKANGGNCIYAMAVRTHGGDGRSNAQTDPVTHPDTLQNPWIDQDPAKGLNERLLDQWDEWFSLMDAAGITVVFFIYDDAIKIEQKFGWPLDASGALHPGEKRFVQSLVNRFKHHKHLIWCVMEEGEEVGGRWRDHIAGIAAAIRDADEHHHPIGAHQHGGNVFFHADDPVIDQFTIQTEHVKVKTLPEFRDWMVTCWQNAAGRYNLNMAECFQHRDDIESGNYAMVRKYNWTAAMSGAYVMVLGMDIANTPPDLLSACRIQQRFFESTDFHHMRPDPALALSTSDYVLAQPGYSYIVYTWDSRSQPGVRNLQAGLYRLRWVDCAGGKEVVVDNVKVAGGHMQWPRPAGFGEEAALYIRRLDAGPAVLPSASSRNVSDSNTSTQKNKPPVANNGTVHTAVNKDVYVQLDYVDADGGPGPYTITFVRQPLHGTLRGEDNDQNYTPHPDFQGRDEIVWKVHDGADESNTARTVIIVGSQP